MSSEIPPSEISQYDGGWQILWQTRGNVHPRHLCVLLVSGLGELYCKYLNSLELITPLCHQCHSRTKQS
jgi:hypothetical protein